MAGQCAPSPPIEFTNACTAICGRHPIPDHHHQCCHHQPLLIITLIITISINIQFDIQAKTHALLRAAFPTFESPFLFKASFPCFKNDATGNNMRYFIQTIALLSLESKVTGKSSATQTLAPCGKLLSQIPSWNLTNNFKKKCATEITAWPSGQIHIIECSV